MTPGIGAIPDAGRLVETASASASLDDFGDPGFVDGLNQNLAGAARYFPFSETHDVTFEPVLVRRSKQHSDCVRCRDIRKPLEA